jgi:hypothetical protein
MRCAETDFCVLLAAPLCLCTLFLITLPVDGCGDRMGVCDAQCASLGGVGLVGTVCERYRSEERASPELGDPRVLRIGLPYDTCPDPVRREDGAHVVALLGVAGVDRCPCACCPVSGIWRYLSRSSLPRPLRGP